MHTLRITGHGTFLAVTVLALFAAVLQCAAQVNVTTWHNDNGRTGQNTQETTLTQAKVGHKDMHGNPDQFGLLCTFATQGQVYAQPLVVAHTNGSMDVYVADMEDYLYKFTISGSWTGCSGITKVAVNLLQNYQGEYPVDCCFVGSEQCKTIAPAIGVLGAPVIDPSTNTLYLVAESQAGNTGPPGEPCLGKQSPSNWVHRLHAIDLATFGNEKYYGPIAIPSETINHARFISQQLLQRPGLLLTYEEPVPTYPTLYIAFSMMDDSTAFPSGWIYAFDAQNLTAGAPFPLYYALAPDTTSLFAGGGVWQGGAGLAAGADFYGGNYLYFGTADGYFDLNSGTRDSADSFLKFQTTLQPASGTYYFSPADQYWRQCNDMDYGSAGTLLIPDSLFSAKYAVKADKEDHLFVIDRTSPGGYTGSSCSGGTYCDSTCQPGCTPCGAANNVVERPIQFATYTLMGGPFARATPSFWGGSSTSGDLGELYYAAPRGQMSRYPVIALGSSCANGGSPPVCNAAVTTTLDPLSDQLGYSATPSVSSNGVGQSNNGIVWAIQSSSTPLGGPRPRILFAFDANTLSELYDSTQCSARDNNGFGFGEKFSVPTVANGFVFVGTQSSLDIFGLNPATCQ